MKNGKEAKPLKRIDKDTRQIDDFVRAARELGGDESRERFDNALRIIGTQKSEARAVVHASDCAVHDAPALEPGPCTCGAIKAER